ncbi:MAG: aryl-sulfate sulfotransferase [Bacteroidota bacterium]
MKRSFTLLFLLLAFSFSFPQNTVGLLSYDPSLSLDGYNLMFPHNQPTVFLLNSCGEIVHSWTDDSNFRPGNIAYILEDGKLVKAKRDAVVTDDAIWAGGGGETVEIRDWDNTLLWTYTLNDSLNRLHHDIAPMPNGNILMVAWELKTREEAIAAGRDTTKLSQDKLWPDYIIEVDPSTDQIVWEWHAWDHLIQDYDSTKSNFGVIADNPGKINLNYDTSEGHPDWMHSNSIDYHVERDQILLSVPTFHEIWIIDHTTTTAQAASNNGGLSGKGGQLLYRWGNPAAYDLGTESDQKLFYQHDAHWIDDFVDIMVPNFGDIAVFNNRVGSDFSTVNVIEPSWNMYGWSYLKNNGVFVPSDFDLTWTHPDTTRLFSTGLSSVQFLNNGNALITSGRFGYSFELTTSNEVVWEYITPFRGGQAVPQGDSLTINQNLTFRMKRYPADYAAFTDRELSPQGWIEQNPDSAYCDQFVLSNANLDKPSLFKAYPNPSSSNLSIEWEGLIYADIEIYNQLGQEILDFPQCSGGRKYLDTSNWENGLYVISINRNTHQKILVQH